MDSRPITLWIQGTPRGFEVYYRGINSLVSVPSREHRVCFSSSFRDIMTKLVLGLITESMVSEVHRNSLVLEDDLIKVIYVTSFGFWLCDVWF